MFGDGAQATPPKPSLDPIEPSVLGFRVPHYGFLILILTNVSYLGSRFLAKKTITPNKAYTRNRLNPKPKPKVSSTQKPVNPNPKTSSPNPVTLNPESDKR